MKTDCIVVGAGVVGLAIANELARSGKGVQLYSSPADEMTAASQAAGAMLGAFGEVTTESESGYGALELAFRVESARMYESWLEETLPEKSGNLIKRGTFIIANSFGRQDRENLEAMRKALTQYEEPFENILSKDIPGYHPSPGLSCHEAIHIPDEGFLDITKLLPLLKEEFIGRANCNFISEKVTGIQISDNSEAEGVILESGEVHKSEYVVVAAGIGTSDILKDTAIQKTLPTLIAGKGVGITLQTDEKFTSVIRTPNRDFACGVHLVPRGEDTIYIGATNRTASVPGTTAGVSVEEVHDILHESVHEIHTGLESANILALHCGTRPLSTDSQVLLGATEIAKLSIATGTYRNGILMAPLIAKTIVAEINGSPDERWSALRPQKEGRSVIYKEAEQLFRDGAEGIVSFLPQPHGKLPYNRADELANALEALLQLSFREEKDLSPQLKELRSEIKTLIDERPMVETFAQLFYRCHDLISEQKISAKKNQSADS